jgi:hypothetical protein
MSKYGDVSANASIEEIDKLNISISINQKNNRNTDIYDYIWDANSKELLTEKTI